MAVNESTSGTGDDPEVVFHENGSFKDFHCTKEILDGLTVEMKFVKPSKAQLRILQAIQAPPYKNFIVQSRNGSGKTACFLLHMLTRVDSNLHVPQMLCICPTRELAIQTMEVLLKIGKFTVITSELCLPNYIPVDKGEPMIAQVIIGTPGIVNSLIAAYKLDISNLKVLVFDEADLVLTEDGFKEDSVAIMKEIVKGSPNCQVLLFSATFNDFVKAFLSKNAIDLFAQKCSPELLKVENMALDNVKQYKVNVPNESSKIKVITEHLMEVGQKTAPTIIFVRNINRASELHKELVKFGYLATIVQVSLSLESKDEMIKKFKDGCTQVLIFTDDLLAWGFDHDKVTLVINHDLPNIPDSCGYEAYSHRVGRTGRFDRKGVVFNLLCNDTEKRIMEKIEVHFNHNVTQVLCWTNDDYFKDAFKES